MFYQYVRTAALNQQQQQTQHVSVFTTELFAHYLHIRCLSVMKCRQLTQTSTGEVQRYNKYLHELQEIFIADWLLSNVVNRTKYQTNNLKQSVVSRDIRLSFELAELLQQSAVDHLTAFRHLEAQRFGSKAAMVTTDFEALYSYKRGEYERCAQLSTHNVNTLIDDEGSTSLVFVYPEFIQLMDDDIASLVGLALIVNRSFRDDDPASVTQLSLSLYLMTQCQMKLRHSVTRHWPGHSTMLKPHVESTFP